MREYFYIVINAFQIRHQPQI